MKTLLPVFLLLTGNVSAQHSNHSGHTDHSVYREATVLSEPGQDMFAALTEIVQKLRADPATDWSRVNLDGLRSHLLDMDLVVREAEVETVETALGLRFQMITNGRVGEALKRMVPAHAPFLASETGWQSEVVTANNSIS